MPTYLYDHHGGGYRYVYHVPKTLQPMLGGITAFRHYIKKMPRREAEALARSYAVKDAALLDECRKKTEQQREGLAAAGGVLRLMKDDIPTSVTDPRFKPEHWQRLQAEAIVQEAEAKTNPPSDVSWDRLLKEWVRIKEPSHPRHHATTIRLLKEFSGEKDCRELKQIDIANFRDAVSSKMNRGTLVGHLQRLGAIFSAVIKEPKSPFHGMINPVSGVVVLGKNPPAKDGRDQVFSPKQSKTILETAARVKFGGKRAEETLWILRLLTFTGARPNEIAQLQGGDVCEENRIKFIRIQEMDCLTGKKHHHKSVKVQDRVVLLHPMVADFFEHAKKFDKQKFIFGKFTWDKSNGRAAWLINNFQKFLQKDCGIQEPGMRLRLYSLRHTFISAMRNAEIPEEVQKQIVGHSKDQHARYGKHDLKKLAEHMKKVKPTG
jgi:integrase